MRTGAVDVHANFVPGCGIRLKTEYVLHAGCGGALNIRVRILVAVASCAPCRGVAHSTPTRSTGHAKIFTPSAIAWSGTEVMLAGDYSKPGLFVLRIKMLDRIVIPPHWPEDKNITQAY